MTIRILNIWLIIMAAGLWSCIDEFDPRIDSYQNLLVVDGGISNEPGPHTVWLSLSSSVADPDYIPIENATVSILDDTGEEFLLAESAAGYYSTDSTVTGIIGRSYKVHIVTSSGKIYESAFETLDAPVKIDTVYHAVVTREDPDFPYILYGYEFYVDTKLADDPENYYKWDLTATYHYQSDYTIRWFFDGELHWFHGPDSLFNCWTTYNVNKIYTGSTNSLSNPVIKAYPLNFVSTETRQLSVRYSLLVKQRTISKGAYDYWNETWKQNGGDWSLYATQPHFVRGNVYNIANREEQVLGYFTVSGVDQMRIFVDRPPISVPMRYGVCTLSEADFLAYGDMGMMDPVYYPLYAIETNGGRRALPHQDCVDCRRKGGTITKPDFWKDK